MAEAELGEDFYAESQHWKEVPASFRSWPEYEDRSASLRDWSPSSRTQRQRRVLMRDDPPDARFIVDELSLYRQVGSCEDMAAQLRRLLEVAAMPSVTVQVLPPIAHPVNASGFLMADDSVRIEHAAGGFVYTEKEVVSSMALRFDTLRGECYRVSESAALLDRLEGQWTGGSLPIRTATEGTA